jgi:hypothetical protein
MRETIGNDSIDPVIQLAIVPLVHSTVPVARLLVSA